MNIKENVSFQLKKRWHHLEDPYLGYLTIEDRHFYVQRSPYKRKIKAKLLQTTEDMDSTVDIMGKIPAKIHSRADVDFQEDLFSYESEQEISKSNR